MPRDEADLKARQAQLKQGWFRQRHVNLANTYRDKLIELYGEEAGKQVKYAEAFEICEYGRRPNQQELKEAVPGDAAEAVIVGVSTRTPIRPPRAGRLAPAKRP